MNNEDMSELFNKFSSMINEGNIPDNMKDILSSISSNNSSKASNNNSSNSSENNTGSSSFDGENTYTNVNSSSSQNSDNSSIDFETILKMKKIMDKMKQNSNDPRANLLLSLKPYLKDSRKEKVDQYIKLFGMSKVLEAFDSFRRWLT